MPEEYTALVAALMALTQETEPARTDAEAVTVKLPMAEDEWRTRPDTVSYGTVSLDFEADALYGDNKKVAVAYEGAVELYSHVKSGDGWVELIAATLTDHCDGSWSLNYHTYERETGLFHWEFVFQVEG